MNPAADLMRLLADARRRGEDFPSAWPEAVAAALRGLPAPDRPGWRDALTATADAWEASFDRQPADTPAMRALAVVGEDPDRVALAVDEFWRTCERCDAGLRANARPNVATAVSGAGERRAPRE